MCYRFGAGFCEFEMVLLQGSETGLKQVWHRAQCQIQAFSLSLSLSCCSFFSSNSFHSEICLKAAPIPRRQEFQEFMEIWESRPRQGAFMFFLLSFSTRHVDSLGSSIQRTWLRNSRRLCSMELRKHWSAIAGIGVAPCPNWCFILPAAPQHWCWGFGAGFCEFEMVLLQGSETGLKQV